MVSGSFHLARSLPVSSSSAPMICLRLRRFSPRAEKLALRTLRCTSDCTSWINFSPGPPSRNCLLIHSLALVLGSFATSVKPRLMPSSRLVSSSVVAISFSLALHAADKFGGLGWPLHSLCNKSARISSAQSSSLFGTNFSAIPAWDLSASGWSSCATRLRPSGWSPPNWPMPVSSCLARRDRFAWPTPRSRLASAAMSASLGSAGASFKISTKSSCVSIGRGLPAGSEVTFEPPGMGGALFNGREAEVPVAGARSREATRWRYAFSAEPSNGSD